MRVAAAFHHEEYLGATGSANLFNEAMPSSSTSSPTSEPICSKKPCLVVLFQVR